MSDRQMVQIACTVPNGVDLRVAGASGIVNLKGPSTGLRAGATNQNPGASAIVTEVDAKFWRRWKDANAKNPLLIGGAISEVKLPDESADKSGDPNVVPTVEEFVAAGYSPTLYRNWSAFDGKTLPSSDADIDAAIAAEAKDDSGQGGTDELSEAELEALTNPESSEAGNDDKGDEKPAT